MINKSYEELKNLLVDCALKTLEPFVNELRKELIINLVDNTKDFNSIDEVIDEYRRILRIVFIERYKGDDGKYLFLGIAEKHKIKVELKDKGDETVVTSWFENDMDCHVGNIGHIDVTSKFNLPTFVYKK